MDLQTAKELDLVLEEFRPNRLVNILISSLRFQKSNTLTFPPASYFRELRDKGLIESTPNTANSFRLTFSGRIFEGFENKLERESREKENNEFHKVIIAWFTGLATFAAVFAVVLQFYYYESPSKIENAESLNKTLSTQKEQLEELYTQSIYKQISASQAEARYLELRDSLRSLKK